MKWLFAVLVALNIIVFGGMVAHRMTDKPHTAAGEPLEGGVHELARPASLNPRAPAASEAAPDWVNAPAGSADAREPESEAAILAREQKAREAKLAREKKAREEKARREQALAEGGWAASDGLGEGARQCQASATVTLDEDDYHRIKGLLGRWPHAASRSVEKRGGKRQKARKAKSFRVLLPTDGDAMARLDDLARKGFNGVLYNGELSMGVARSHSSAQILISRLAAAGFGGARVSVQDDASASPEDALSVSRMTVTFIGINERDAQDIRGVVERYGRLNFRGCR